MVVGYDVLLADAQLVHSPVYCPPLRLAFVGTCWGPLGCPSLRCPAGSVHLAHIGLCVSSSCTLKIIPGNVIGYPAGPDLYVCGQLMHIDLLTQGHVARH